jgi:mono/diheme cytochrome c family protein
MPGAPKKGGEWKPESAITNFKTLYGQNCLACHGDGATTAASLPMNFPLYLHFIPEEKLRTVIADGVPGTLMPGFAQSNGGQLAPNQIDALVAGILAWRTGHPPTNLPPYEAPLGDIAAGATAYAANCASCHGPNGHGGTAGSILAPAYLGLVSDQYLRTVTVVGRPNLGMPPSNLTDPEVANLVAWMASHRPAATSRSGGFQPPKSAPSETGDLQSPTPPNGEAANPSPAPPQP